MTKIHVKQFDSGYQGSLRSVEVVHRLLRTSTVCYPVYAGCCSSVVKLRKFHWVNYRGNRWEVENTAGKDRTCGLWFINLPGEDVLERFLDGELG
jgi:hypothetical protein